MNDYEKFWLTGPGIKCAHHFSADWLDAAVLTRAKVSGDLEFAERLLPELIRQYKSWSNHFDAKIDLYWSIPADDAMEYEAASLETKKPFSCVPMYRPTLNSYQYGNAIAISVIADRAGKPAIAARFKSKAQALRKNMLKWLWGPHREFFYDVLKPGNPQHQRLDAREIVDFIPWYFDIPGPTQTPAWQRLFDPPGFKATYGRTTVEQRRHWFMHKAENPRGWDDSCCHWDGPSWPFSTTQTLTGMANLLNDYHQDVVNVADYDHLLHTYAATQFKNGPPWVAEATDPDTGRWIYDAEGHSEHYFHSTFNDLDITGLIGFRPQVGRKLTINPLAPTSWNYFCLENVPYHGHDVTILWDRNGEHYHHGAGLRVYQDGELLAHSTRLHRITVALALDRKLATDIATSGINAAANLTRHGHPKAIASYNGPRGSPRQAIDGQILYDQYVPRSRWTDFRSGDETDWLSVDFGRSTPVQDVRVFLDDAGGMIKRPASFKLQYWTRGAWRDAPDLHHAPGPNPCSTKSTASRCQHH